MKMKSVSGGTLFLMEFIVIVFVLVLSVAVTMGFFAKTHETAEKSGNLVNGALIAQSVAEEIRSGKTVSEKQYFDESGRESKMGEYKSIVTSDVTEKLTRYTITVYREKKEIYTLVLQHYGGKEVVKV